MTSGRCVFCGIDIEVDGRIGRLDECPNCKRDLHACLQCRFYERSAHNQCHENQAPYIGDKERSNFCEYFVFGREVEGEQQRVDASRKKLEELFKKA